MKIKLANKFLIVGLGLYICAGIAAITNIDYSVIFLLAAIMFLAFGFFVNRKSKWARLFKKKI